MEAASKKCSEKVPILKISSKPKENICEKESYFSKVADFNLVANGIKEFQDSLQKSQLVRPQ